MCEHSQLIIREKVIELNKKTKFFNFLKISDFFDK